MTGMAVIFNIRRRAAAIGTELPLAACLLALDVVARLFPHAPNFTPMAASALFAGVIFRSRLVALTTPIAAAGHRAPAQNTTIRLVVDYGDGVIKTVTGLPWSKGSTVLDVMNAAKAHPHGITFSYTGSGDAAFLTRIDEIPNEGGGGGRKSWQLWVNTAYADRSFGVYEVQAFDVVYWRFTTKEGK